MSREEDLFAEALELPPLERAVFLERLGRDEPVLRDRLVALLEAHAASERFFSVPPVVPPPRPPEEKPGDVIGHYTLLRQIGAGGCGVVYLAEQTEPLRRQVALKVIKLGMDTREVIARFEAERQALARMDHPDIARVFDAGVTTAGRSYFVMEFVDGQPITKFCDAQDLPLAGRLELFVRVALALQHAHLKGIIHRDVKPSNILVTMRDGVTAPKIIDFGIAKATQGRLTEHTLITHVEQFMGTPAYMSPEQAELRETDIDTRSDVYSLGVLLYELLTGRPPFDPRSLVQAGIAEIRRIIREVDPPRPSTVISTLGLADRTSIARRRRASPARLPSVLRGDLDWIVMHCLEKDPARRYHTAHDLALDIRRHLQAEPVSARPPSAAYRTRKFARRHRVACSTIAAVALSLIAGAIVSARQAIRATRAEHVAQQARRDAQRRQADAEELLTFMLGDFRTELQKIGRLQLLDAVGEKAQAYFAALDPRDLTDTALTRQARALTQIGETRLDEARYPEATKAFATAYARAAALFTRHPSDADMLFERAQAEFWLGYAARQRADDADARNWLTRYRDSSLALAKLEGGTPRARREIVHGHHNLAVLDFDAGHFAEAERGFQAERTELVALLAREPGDTELAGSLADAASWLGTIAERTGSLPHALERYVEAAQRYEALTRMEPAVAAWQTSLAESLTLLGSAQGMLGQRTNAAATYARALSVLEPLTKADPANQEWRLSTAVVRLQQSGLLAAAGDFSPAQAKLDETRAGLEALVAKDPASRWYRRHLAVAWRYEARLRLHAGRADAAGAIDQALRLGEAIVRLIPRDHLAAGEYAQACVLAGRIAAAAGHRDLAERHWDRAIAVLSPLVPDSSDWRLLDPAAQAFVLLGRTPEARPLITRLRQAGYQPIDPLAASLLDAADPNPDQAHKP